VKEITINTKKRIEMLDITPDIQKAVNESGVSDGVCHVFVPHTTAGVTINENADPDVTADIQQHMTKLVPRESDFKHGEGNSDGHIKSSLFGPSQVVFIESGRLVLGIWQAVYFCECDGPRTRKALVKIMQG